jgi:hypothetical protein
LADLDLEDLDLDDLAKMGSHTGFSVGLIVGLLVVGMRRNRDGLEDMDGVDVGVRVGLIVGYSVGETVG